MNADNRRKISVISVNQRPEKVCITFSKESVAFNWLTELQHEVEKPDNYAEKTLAAYRLGMKAKGSIVGVRIEIGQDGCTARREIDVTAVYHPDDAPILPLSGCTKGNHCGCVYRPVMRYEIE